MSEYKFVQWGKGVPVDYQRLGQMVSNEEYLKSKVDPSPKGVLLWKQRSGIGPLDPSGTYQAVTGFSSLPFDVDENRLISFSFNPGLGFTNSSGQLRFRFSIDSVYTDDISGGGSYYGGLAYQGYFSPGVSDYIPPEALPKGTHTVSVELVADSTISALYIGNSTKMTLIVRDEGQFISAAP
jgi:hypothetical protein